MAINGVSSGQLLIVEDEAFIREAMQLYLLTDGFQVHCAASGEQAIELLSSPDGADIDLAILDILMPGMSGIDLLGHIKKRHSDIEVIMASGCGTLETAVESMRMGAYDYIPKPILDFENDLLRVVRKALERRRLLAANRELAIGLQERNSELKQSNQRLNRNLAAMDLLFETGQLITGFETLQEVLCFAKDTLTYQIQIDKGVLVLENHDEPPIDNGQKEELPRTIGIALGLSLETGKLLPDGQSTIEALAKASPDCDWSNARPFTIKAGNRILGTLVIISKELAEKERLLCIFSSQLSAPLSLFRNEVVTP